MENQSYNINLVRPKLATYLLTGFCCLTIFLGFLNFLLHASFRSLRRKTGTIIFTLILVETFCIICYLLSSVGFQDYNGIYFDYPGYNNREQECQILGAFTFYFFIVSRVYSVCVSDEMQRVIMNPTYSSKNLHIIYHLVSNAIGIILVIVFALTDNFGFNFSLMCMNQFKIGVNSLVYKQVHLLNFSLLYSIFLAIFVLYTSFNLYYLYRRTPKVLEKQVRGHIIRFTIYLCAEIFTDVANVVFVWLSSMQHDYFRRDSDDLVVNKVDGFQVIRWFSVVLNIALPLLLALLRITQYQVVDVFSNKMDECCNRRKKRRGIIVEVEQELEEKHLNFIDIYQDGHSFKTRTTSKSAGDFSSRSTVKELSVYLSINTILTGLTYSLSDLQNSNVLSKERKEEFVAYSKDFKQKISTTLERKQSISYLYNNDVMASKNRNFEISITQYAPNVFQHLRTRQGISIEELIYAFAPINNAEALESFQQGAGKSNSFFFFTQNKKFILKTITKSELDTLRDRLLPKYFKHMQNQPSSLLIRMLGAFAIGATHMQKMYVILMKNLTSQKSQFISRMYDLKGSTYGRNALKHIQKKAKKDINLSVLKDLDMLNLKDWLYLNLTERFHFLNVIQADSQMLAQCQIMDYSLLLIKYEYPYLGPNRVSSEYKESSNFFNDIHSFNHRTEPNIKYRFAIIDYLQYYNFKKKIELQGRILANPRESTKQYSVLEPKQYSTRFIKFMQQITVEQQEQHEPTVQDIEPLSLAVEGEASL